MKRRRGGGVGVGRGYCRIRACVVGVPVYHVALWVMKSVQKEGVRRVGIMTLPPEYRGARVEARRP